MQKERKNQSMNEFVKQYLSMRKHRQHNAIERMNTDRLSGQMDIDANGN